MATSRPDILTAKGWFEAPANPRAGTWTFHPDFQLLPPRGQCSPIYAHDVNGDGKKDVVYGAGHQYGVFWLENLGGKWKTHTIDDSWSQAHAVTLADLIVMENLISSQVNDTWHMISILGLTNHWDSTGIAQEATAAL